MKKLIHTAVVTLLATSAAQAQQAVQWREVPELTGHYGIKDYIYTIWGLEGPLLNGCRRDAPVRFAWHGSEGPRYFIYELTGTMVAPTFEWTDTPFEWQRPEAFNLNGGMSMQGGPAIGFGLDYGVNDSVDIPGVHWLSTYDRETGRVYCGLVYSVRESGWVNFPSDEMMVSASFLLNYYIPVNNIRYLTAGSVHIESIRVGISDEMYVLGSEPLTPLNEPSTCDGDLTQDCAVDGQDLGLLLSVWGSSKPAADLNVDGIVDGADLGYLLASWGSCS
jgi:hypothetical protein